MNSFISTTRPMRNYKELNTVNHGEVNLTAASKLAKGKLAARCRTAKLRSQSFPQKPSSIQTLLLITQPQWQDTGQTAQILRQNGRDQRRVPVEGVDILGACVAQKKRRIVGGHTHPASPARRLVEVFQAGHLLQLMVADSNPEYARILCRR